MMTIERPTTTDMVDKVTRARSHLVDARSCLIDVKAELDAVVNDLPSLPQKCDLDLVIADLRNEVKILRDGIENLRNDSFYLRHCIYLLGGAVSD